MNRKSYKNYVQFDKEFRKIIDKKYDEVLDEIKYSLQCFHDDMSESVYFNIRCHVIKLVNYIIDTAYKFDCCKKELEEKEKKQ